MSIIKLVRLSNSDEYHEGEIISGNREEWFRNKEMHSKSWKPLYPYDTSPFMEMTILKKYEGVRNE